MNTFLESLLPRKGPYCSLGIYKKNKRAQAFHADISEIEERGSTLTENQWDAYFALASFNDDSSRTQSNAAYLKCFFADLDCGAGKPYETQAEAADALKAFVKKTGLPLPTVTNSGYGLHIYWPLTEDVPAAVWAPVAQALKDLMQREGLGIDPVVVADSARVLRIPGTSNFKRDDDPRLVQILRMGPATTLGAFKALLPPVAAVAMPALVDFSAAKAFRTDDDITQNLVSAEFPPSSFARIVRRSAKGVGCAQIAHIVTHAAVLEEPLWRAGLSIAQHCDDGAEAIHQVSQGHPGYDRQDTINKAAATKGPYTCEWFKRTYPDTCKGCTRTVTSPIALGVGITAAVPATDGTYLLHIRTEPDIVADAPIVEVTIPKLPWPYFRGTNGGIYRQEKDKDGERVDVEVYHRDLYITNRFFDLDAEGSGDGELVGINLHLEHDGVRRFHSPVAQLFATETLRATLVKHGVIAHGKQLEKIMNYFGASIRQLQAQYAANRTRSQMGWTPDMQGFVVGELEYTISGTKLAPPTSGTRQLAEAFKPVGTIEAWSRIANYYSAPGMEAHALAVCFGFGSPLLKLLNNSGVHGAMVNLMSNVSGTGKTTAQLVVNSIFGNPSTLLLIQKDSVAATYHSMGLMNSLALTVDEITNTPEATLSDFIYGASSGRGRHRMESQSNRMRPNTTTWCNMTITSSNSSVVDKMSNYKNTADGELRRVLEIHVPQPSENAKAISDELFNGIVNNFGVAGPVFIQYVLRNRAHVIETIKQVQTRIDIALNLTNADRYYSSSMACAISGGFIAKHLGLINYDMERLFHYGNSVITQNKRSTQTATGDPITIASEAVTAYINDNINSVLVIHSVGRGGLPSAPIRDVRGNQLKIRYEPDRQELFVVASDFRKFLSGRQVDVQRSLSALTIAGIMKHGGQEKSKRIGAGALVGVPAMPTRCYCMDGKVIGLDPHCFDPVADATSISTHTGTQEAAQA